MTETYHKLVRDRIPEIIQAAGKACETEILNELEYQQALKYKLLEEAQEVVEATPEDFLKELADLCEVIDTLMNVYRIDRAALWAEQEHRRRERGGFSQQICLLKVWTIGDENPIL